MQISLSTRLDSLAFWRPDQSFDKARDVASSIAASAARGWSGSRVARLGARPEQLPILYEKEPDPGSRLVREALSILDIDAEMHPCPEGELRHRAELKSKGGTEAIPFLIDPNTDRRLHGWERIVRYLFSAYGDGRVPGRLRAPLALTSSRLASRIRGHAGTHKEPARRPDRPLELYGFEAGPHTRLVREQLSTLGLPWICRNRAHGSAKRGSLEQEIGRVEFPYLRDPNTGRGVRESDVICAYLAATYGR